MPSLPHPVWLAVIVLALLALGGRGVYAIIRDIRTYIRTRRQTARDEAEQAIVRHNPGALRKVLRRQWWPPRRLVPTVIGALLRDAIQAGNAEAIRILAARPAHTGGWETLVGLAAIHGVKKPAMLDEVLNALYNSEAVRREPLRRHELRQALDAAASLPAQQAVAERLASHLAGIDRDTLRIAVGLPDAEVAPGDEPEPPQFRHRKM